MQENAGAWSARGLRANTALTLLGAPVAHPLASRLSRAEDMAASLGTWSWQVWDVPGGDLRRAEVFDFRETERKQFFLQLVCFKITDPGFTNGFDAGGAAVVVCARLPGECVWRVTVIEDDMRAAGQAGNEGERGPDGLFREVRNDSEPGEECMLRGIEAGGG